MQITNADETEWKLYGGQREGRTDYKLLARGKQGSPDAYELTIVKWSPEGTYSPRHRHNFEQFRFPLNMALNYSPDLDVPVNQLGYFSEGGYYGPQKISGGCLALMLQFAGPSGFGFMNYDETKQGSDELLEFGRFEKGIFRRESGEGPVNQDGYEAVWQHVNGKPVEYVSPRYPLPILIDPEAFEWATAQGVGASVRSMAVFNERGTGVSQYRIEPGGSITLESESQARLFFVLEGVAQASGTECRTHAALAMGPDEVTELSNTGTEPVTLLNYNMPKFD